MNCNQSTALIGAYADGELEGARCQDMMRHLDECPACAASHADLIALRGRIRAQTPRYAAPATLRADISARVASLPQRSIFARLVHERGRWIGAGALAGCAATLLAFVVTHAIIDARAREDLTNEAVAAHVRAQLDDHLIAVASSDRHTVKPWLSARLDYSPPVQDLARDGFALAGGRLDHLAQKPVATLVYRYRLHTVDVFVRPAAGDADFTLRTLRGFNVASVTAAGMQWIVVSDAEADVLRELVDRLTGGGASPH